MNGINSREVEGIVKYRKAPSENTCLQCGPNTITYQLASTDYPNHCTRIFLTDPCNSRSSTGVLCVGRNGVTKFCRPGEFMAVSHVWAHGWQGSREDGICSTVLELLLNIARASGIEWIWLDVAMISSDPDSKALSINDMDSVYSTAAFTLVCDKLLAALEGANVLQKGCALTFCDWNKRLWTMQEAMLSKSLKVASRSGNVWDVQALLRSLFKEANMSMSSNYFPPIRDISALLEPIGRLSTDETLSRVVRAGRHRQTTKRLDLVRALFPLFGFKWSREIQTFQQAHNEFMERLGPLRFQCITLFAPFGIPGPHSSLPISIVPAGGVLFRNLDSPRPVCDATGQRIGFGIPSSWVIMKARVVNADNIEQPPVLQTVRGRTAGDTVADEFMREAPKLVRFEFKYDRLRIGRYEQAKGFCSPAEDFPWQPGEYDDGWLSLLRIGAPWGQDGSVNAFVVAKRISLSFLENGCRLWAMKKVGIVLFSQLKAGGRGEPMTYHRVRRPDYVDAAAWT